MTGTHILESGTNLDERTWSQLVNKISKKYSNHISILLHRIMTTLKAHLISLLPLPRMGMCWSTKRPFPSSKTWALLVQWSPWIMAQGATENQTLVSHFRLNHRSKIIQVPEIVESLPHWHSQWQHNKYIYCEGKSQMAVHKTTIMKYTVGTEKTGENCKKHN